MDFPTRRVLLCAASSPALLIGSAVLAEEPVEYVRICDAFGNGYFYIPGTETCLRVAGHTRAYIYTGSKMSIKSLAFEPVAMVLVNPFDTVDAEIEGRGVSFGVSGQLGGAVSRWGYVFNVHFNEIEGRGTSGGWVPNVGITAVGETPGLFIDYPTDYMSHASFNMDQWGALFETNYLLYERIPTVPSQWSFGVKALAGLHYTNTDSDINYGAVFHYDYDKATSAYYATNFRENTLIPYVGAAVGFQKKFDNFDLGIGLTGRVGAAFSSYDGTDRLSAYGDNVNSGTFEPFQQTHIDDSATTPYVSFTGGIGITRGRVTLSLSAAAEYGAYRNPNIYRPDSLDADTPLATEIDPEAVWTYNVGAEVTVRFRPQRSF